MNAERLSLHALEEAALDKLFERGMQFRLYLGPVVFLSTVAALAWDATPWRRYLTFTLVIVVAARFLFEALRARKLGIARSRLSRLLPVPATVLIFVVTASGGVDSPVIVLLPLVTVFLSMFLRPSVGVRFAIIFSVTAWVLTLIAHLELVSTLMPELLGGGARGSNGAMLISRATMVTIALIWGALIGWVMRGAFRVAIQRALDARDEALHTHGEATRTLTTMTAEIAHELKNPLASVKGLAALLDREAEGKNLERLTVLRREVDRMQEILESFLTFSRPVVPLQVAPVALHVLVDQVVALHEGLAHERAVSFRVDARDLSVKADARKLKQVLINLVQNALDVSKPESAIDLVVRTEGEGAAVLVMDRGPGVQNAERAFEAGVTTKEKGSGLGLTVSRQLARQHGGELKLLARDGGGTIAELVLPGAPP